MHVWDKEELKRANIVGVERLCNKNCSEMTNVPIQVWKWKTYHPFWSTMILMTRFLKIGLSFWTLVATQKDSPGRKIIQYKLQRADSHSQPIKVSYFLSNINFKELREHYFLVFRGKACTTVQVDWRKIEMEKARNQILYDVHEKIQSVSHN